MSREAGCRVAVLLVCGLVGGIGLGRADEQAGPVGPVAPPLRTGREADPDQPIESTRRALILCGHAGDDEHRKQFAETVESLRASLVNRLGFDSSAVWVLFGGEETGDGTASPAGTRGPSTQQSIAQTVAELKQAIQPQDDLWVIVIGHAHFDRRHSWFNIPGPDLNEQSFGQLFEGIACREQVFWITTPVSGYYIKPLAAAGRVIVSATEADREINETTFPHELAKLLANPPAAAEFDADQDGTLSLFDLYVTLARRIAQSYADQMQVCTEHAQLEDNGDGRGSEVQIDFLSPDLGGRNTSGSPVPRVPAGDGHLSAQILLRLKEITAAPVTDSPSP